MKLIITGSESLFVNGNFVEEILQCHTNQFENPYMDRREVVSTEDKGVSFSAELYVTEYDGPKWAAPTLTVFKTDTEQYGEEAVSVRNKEMAEYAEALLLIWTEDSEDLRELKEYMLSLGKPVYEVVLRINEPFYDADVVAEYGSNEEDENVNEKDN